MILGILQARFNSSRLPGKVLKPILGQPMLARQLERLQRTTRLDRLVVATSDEANDDGIAALCELLNVSCYRGNLDDVLDRFYQAALPLKPDHVVRFTGDCPLAEPSIIDQLIKQHLAEKNDYSANCLQPSFPDGLDVEIMTFSALMRAWQEATLPSEREHVTPYIHKNPGIFKIGELQHPQDLSCLRWTVDEPEDLQLIEEIYQALYMSKPDFTWQDVLSWLEQNPAWRVYNLRHERNAGMKKSLLADEAFIQKY